MPSDVKDNATASQGIQRESAITPVPLREKMAAWRRKHPLPPPTGAAADKAFFDSLSGDLDEEPQC